MIARSILILCFFCSTFQIGFAQELILYKEVDTTKLYMEVIYPENMQEKESYPALVFFFGGGWIGGSRDQFKPQAEYFAKRGMVCFLVDYRIKNIHQTSPFESLKDAKSAIRFVRAHASDFQIEPHKIIAAGGSAGGHLATATALSPGLDEGTDDFAVSAVPNALILFNPVIDNGPGGYGFERIGEAYTRFSPLHNIKAGAPPTLFMLGTKDRLIPVITGEYYKMVMEKVGSRCDLILYEDQPHGFFNYSNFENFKKTLLASDEFLQSLGYLKKEPIIDIE